MGVAILLLIALVSPACSDTNDTTKAAEQAHVEYVAKSPPVRISCIGDSITYGVGGDAFRANPIPFGSKQRLPVDPVGGYPGRLARRLGDRAAILSRGVPSSTTHFWLVNRNPFDDFGPARVASFFSRMDWKHFEPQKEMWEAPNLLLGALRTDRPDVVILLIGINDLVPGLAPAGVDIVESIISRLGVLRQQAETVADRVLVSTLLPNERDPEPVIARLNARIRLEHPDFLPLGEGFAAREWKQMLSDEIHPNDVGYEFLAELVEKELLSRGLVAPAYSIR
jgi:lysophospholipase L1-like esterase